MADFQSIFDLTGKTAIITGAAGNLGPSFANALANFGANVALLDLHEDRLDKLSNDICSSTKVSSTYHVCDLTNSEAVKNTVHQIVTDHGMIDVLINNAQAKDAIVCFENASLADWRITSAINEEAVFLTSQAVGLQMIKQQKGGSIINISSIYGIMAPDHRIYQDANFGGSSMGSPAVYSYTKAGLIGLTRYLSTYWAHHNIRVNALTPGGVESSQSDNFKRQYNDRVPLQRMAQPLDLAGALVFLASDASAYMTGQNLVLDGGLSAW